MRIVRDIFEKKATLQITMVENIIKKRLTWYTTVFFTGILDYHRQFFDIDLAKHSYSFLSSGINCETHWDLWWLRIEIMFIRNTRYYYKGTCRVWTFHLIDLDCRFLESMHALMGHGDHPLVRARGAKSMKADMGSVLAVHKEEVLVGGNEMGRKWYDMLGRSSQDIPNISGNLCFLPLITGMYWRCSQVPRHFCHRSWEQTLTTLNLKPLTARKPCWSDHTA